jgi:2'-5' RNA ligase
VPRRRLAAALLLAPPWSTEIDGLRRACGDAQLARVAPHITLVPPVNVREDDLSTVLALVRRAATALPSGLDLRIGPTATFLPESPVLYLQVAGPGVDDGGLAGLRDRLRAGPLARPDRWPFVPHVTLMQDQPAERLVAGVAALGSYTVETGIDRLHLLEEQAGPVGGRRWVPIADARFGARVVVGRGSLPLELTTGSVVDPEARSLWPRSSEADPLGGGTNGDRVVVTARRSDGGELVGLAAGHRQDAEPEVLVVAPSARGEGAEGHLLSRWRWSAEVS